MSNRETLTAAGKELMELLSPVDGRLLKDGWAVEVFATPWDHGAVDVYRVRGMTQSTLGCLRTRISTETGEAEFTGVFHSYGENPFNHAMQRIDLSGRCADEIVSRFIECLAPLLQI